MPRTHLGFFLRTEDFFGFARTQKQRAESLDDLAERFAADPRGRAYMFAQKQALTSRSGEDLRTLSHGASFLRFFESRMIPGGLYLLDEPEAALSPQRQLAFLSLPKQLVAADARTHTGQPDEQTTESKPVYSTQLENQPAATPAHRPTKRPHPFPKPFPHPTHRAAAARTCAP